jgi:hypothetical protein
MFHHWWCFFFNSYASGWVCIILNTMVGVMLIIKIILLTVIRFMQIQEETREPKKQE